MLKVESIYCNNKVETQKLTFESLIDLPGQVIKKLKK